MALTGLEIYKLLPKTNCKKCGFPTCLAFAMALAAKKASLEQCPDVSEETKKILSEAAEPPIRTVVLKEKYKIGGETVLFRHEKTFYNPCLIGVLIKDTFEDRIVDERLNRFCNLEFEKLGQKLGTELLLIKSEKNDFERLKNIFSLLDKNLSSCKRDFLLGLISEDPQIVESILKIRKLDLIGILTTTQQDILEKFVTLAKQNKIPLVVGSENLDKVVELINKVVEKYGYRELIINVPVKNYSQLVEDLTQIRRLALKKNFRPLGYPTIVIIEKEDDTIPFASSAILKYGSVVVVNSVESDIHLALVTLRLNIYTDPQKPTTVEPKLYNVGGQTTPYSPLMVTTNFSLTYYSVEPEILNSKIPSWLLVVDTDGLSVLTAWAAEKFTAEKVVEAIKKENVEEKVKNKKLIIPGYVAVMSGKLNDLLPDWEIIVGPKEASGIPKFLKTIFQ